MAARLGGNGADSSSGGEPSDIQWHGWRKWWWWGRGGGGKGGDSDESQERDGTYTFEWDISLLLSIRTALDT